MGSRARRIFGEAIKFSAVNVVATAVAVVLFNALVHGLPALYGPGPLHGYPVVTYFVANTVGMLISFYGSRQLRVQAPPAHRTGRRPGELRDRQLRLVRDPDGLPVGHPQRLRLGHA